MARVSNNCTLSMTFDTPSEQTKPTVTLFVSLLKYAHIRVIMTLLACLVMARVPVHSPLSLKSSGGSHIILMLILVPRLDNFQGVLVGIRTNTHLFKYDIFCSGKC